jgi:hypothetical protein
MRSGSLPSALRCGNKKMLRAPPQRAFDYLYMHSISLYTIAREKQGAKRGVKENMVLFHKSAGGQQLLGRARRKNEDRSPLRPV